MARWRSLAAAALACLAADAAFAATDLAALTAAAHSGDAEAAYRLGRAYKTGHGAPADLQSAERWFETAAKQGHAKAGAELGLVLHQEGRSVEALPWLRKAAEAGDPRAQYSLATILFAGEVVPADADAARGWMRKAARAGLPAATEALAIMSKPLPTQPALAGGERQPPNSEMEQNHRPALTPVAAETSRAPAKPAVSAGAGAWQVQLGAFSVASNATGYWNKLRNTDGRGLEASFPVRGGLTLFRLGPFANRAEAERFCLLQRKAGRDCVAKERKE